jgi:hypothetical protein
MKEEPSGSAISSLIPSRRERIRQLVELGLGAKR